MWHASEWVRAGHRPGIAMPGVGSFAQGAPIQLRAQSRITRTKAGRSCGLVGRGDCIDIDRMARASGF